MIGLKRKHASHFEADHYRVICEIAAVNDAKFSSCGVMSALIECTNSADPQTVQTLMVSIKAHSKNLQNPFTY